MVLIKLSAHHKIVAIGMAVLLAVSHPCFAMAKGVEGEARRSDVPRAATTVTQSYVSETRDECIDIAKYNSNNAILKIKKKIYAIKTAEKKKSEALTKQEKSKVTYVKYYTNQDAIDIARVLYNECRGVGSITEQACVAWTVLNRVDYNNASIRSVVRSPNQFAFSSDAPVWNNLLKLSYDVLERWNREKNGEKNVGRVLPKEYRYFEGYDGHNHFRNKYNGSYKIWDYSIKSPYKN